MYIDLILVIMPNTAGKQGQGLPVRLFPYDAGDDGARTRRRSGRDEGHDEEVLHGARPHVAREGSTGHAEAVGRGGAGGRSVRTRRFSPSTS